MMAGKQKNEKFLRNYGGLERNDLTNLLNNDSEYEENAATIIKMSNYHDIDDFLNKPIFRNKDQFKVLSFNAESIFSKLNDIKLFLETLRQSDVIFDALCINECWLDIYGEDLNLEGYLPFPLTERCGRKGGLVTFVLEDYKVKDLDLYPDSEIEGKAAWEGQFLELKGNGLRTKLLLSNLYIPPRTTNDFTEYTSKFFPIINSLADKYKHMIIAGDTNADALQFNSNSQFRDYYDKLTNNGLLPLITLPTHFGTRNGSILDHIYVKTDVDLSDIYAGISLHKFSHHLPVFISIPLKNIVKELPKFTNVTKASTNNWNCLANELDELNWDNIFNTENTFSNPNVNYTKFVNKIIDLKSKHMPTKKVRFKRYKHKNNAWITESLISSIKHKDQLYKNLHSLTRTDSSYESTKLEFKKYEKTLKKTIDQVKKTYYNNQFIKYQADIKNTWVTIKSILNKNRSSRKMQTKFCVNGSYIEGDLKIANEFNKYFSEIGPLLASEINQSNFNSSIRNFLSPRTHHTFRFTQVTQDIILKIIKNFTNKPSSGYDNINSIFIKKMQNQLSLPITILVNQSLATGIFPEKLKIAKIIPLYKKNDDDKMSNYRPISLLPVFSKIFEKVVQNQLYNYLSTNNLLFESQHGFRENYSTETATIELVDYLKLQIDNKHNPLCLFLDLSKAFDTINFDILLLKLKHLGINNIALNWFTSYLTDRMQFVSFNEKESDYLNTKTGVPQGSVLGPLLFLIYINDLNNVSNLFKVICFADDSTLIISLCLKNQNCTFCRNANSFSSEIINDELNKIFSWFCINKLSINPDKTKYMIFKTKQSNLSNLNLPTLILNGEILERVNEFLYLGTFLDENLTWDSHINYISNKISKSIGILRRLKFAVPRNILRTIYFALIHPHLNYGTLTWGFNLNRIEKLQKQAVRIITHSYYLEHTSNLFKRLRILKIEDIFWLKQLVFYYKFIWNTLPTPIKNILTTQSNQVRACHTAFFLKPPIFVNTENAKQCIRHSIPKLINGSDKKFIVNIISGSIANLRLLYKDVTYLNYNTECEDENCYPCTSRFFSPFGFPGLMKYIHIFFFLKDFTYQKIFISEGILMYLNIYNYTITLR